MDASDNSAPRARSALHDFLAPDSIAVIGASQDPTKRGYKAMLGLIKGHYRGRLYPINPKIGDVLGVATCPSLDDVPGSIDLAIICTPATSVPEIMVDCARKGVKGAVVLASGFREIGAEGARLEQQILDAARSGGVRIIGPNTSGMFNLHKQVNPLDLRNIRAGGIGFVSQSGNMLLALVLEAEYNSHVGFSTYVGPGNQTDLGFNDYLEYFAEDEPTRVAAFYVEGFRDGQEFLEISREVTALKPVVVYKSGASEMGKQSAASHTGSLAGSYDMTVDLLKQVGVSVVRHSDQILPVAEGLALLPPAQGRRVAVLSDGGGQGTITVDRISDSGLELAQLSEATRKRLGEILFPQASLANPVDVAGTSDADPEVLARCLEILADDDNVDALMLVGMFGGYHIRYAESLLGGEMRATEAIIELSQRINKPVVIYSLYAPVKPPALRRLHESGLPVYSSIEHAVKILQALAERGSYLQNRCSPPQRPDIEASAAMQAMFSRAQHEGRNLYEFEARSLLREHGILIGNESVVGSADELAAAAADFGDQPLVMKVVSKDILHKSDAGGVKLNLRGETALREAFAEIMENCRAYAPDADLRGVQLTPMVDKGQEIIIGMVRDPIYGPVLMFGLGGIFVEILEDVAFRSIPLCRLDAELMIDQLKGSRILSGVRGAAGVDKAALIELLLRISSIVTVYPQISELDLNPIIAYPDGYSVVDARIIINPSVLND